MQPLSRRIKSAIKHVLGQFDVRLTITIFSDDRFIVGYPKSGNTWLRFLVANLMNPDEPVDFSTVSDRVLEMNALLTDPQAKRASRPRLLHGHAPLDVRYGRVLMIVRDPRDVVVSYYHHVLGLQRISDTTSIEQFVDLFLDGKLDKYGSWEDNVAGWLGAREGRDDFMHLRYEDLLKDTYGCLHQVGGFLGLRTDEQAVKAAVESSTSDKMRKMEHTGSDHWRKRLRPGSTMVRKAKKGSWREELPPECALKIEQKFGRLMCKLGYLNG